MQRGVTVRDGNFNTHSMLNSTVLTQPVSISQTGVVVPRAQPYPGAEISQMMQQRGMGS